MILGLLVYLAWVILCRELVEALWKLLYWLGHDKQT